MVVTVYKRGDGRSNEAVSDAEVGRITGLGYVYSPISVAVADEIRYNPATQAKGFTAAQADSVKSKSKYNEWALQDTQQKVQARF